MRETTGRRAGEKFGPEEQGERRLFEGHSLLRPVLFLVPIPLVRISPHKPIKPRVSSCQPFSRGGGDGGVDQVPHGRDGFCESQFGDAGFQEQQVRSTTSHLHPRVLSSSLHPTSPDRPTSPHFILSPSKSVVLPLPSPIPPPSLSSLRLKTHLSGLSTTLLHNLIVGSVVAQLSHSC
ncbi:hypothetical protein BDY24DRAFT_276814 [Mrakia frigida]|uniref:uncharacterized protein n=1 Tax=Mrakia frigida TaxID=29902 RepID=UPI003FCC192B